VAPYARASAWRAAYLPTAMMSAAPFARAVRMASNPMLPMPTTTTLSGSATAARLTPCTLTAVGSTSAASAVDSSGGRACSWYAGTRT